VSSLQVRLRSHVAIPLYRSAYALMAGVAVNSLLGFLFWAIASRTYSTHAVGVDSAAIAALTFLTGIGGLFLDGSLYRFLPRAGDATGRLVAAATVVTVASATLAAVVFIAGHHVWAPDLSFLRSSGWVVLVAILSVVGSCLLVLVDGALIGVRRAGWVPIKGSAYGLAKIVVLAICVALVPRYGILVAWVAPSALVLLGSAWLLGRRLLPLHREASRESSEQFGVAPVVRYATGNYVAFLCNLAYRTLPPLLVIHELGARSSAFFYVPWLVSTSLVLLTNNLSVSLVVEGSLDPRELTLQTRRALRQFIRLILPISGVLLVGSPYILRVFGQEYASHGASLLRLLALGLVPASIAIIAIGVARVQDHVRLIIVTQFVLAVLVLGLGAVFIRAIGLEGFGLSWLIAQTAVAVWLARRELRPVLKPPRRLRRRQMLRLEALEGEVERLEREFREGLTRLDSPERAR
jgi:O-antigen/teichoic acid export membrane protein